MATIPRFDERGRGIKRPHPDPLTSWNPQRQRSDDPHQHQERRDDPYRRSDNRSDRRDDPYHRSERQEHHSDSYRRSERHDNPYHRSDRSDRHDDPYRRTERHDHRDEPYHHRSDRRDEHHHQHHHTDTRQAEHHHQQHPTDSRQAEHHAESHPSSLSSQSLPPPSKPITVDFKMTTDFLVCGEDDAAVKLATVDDIAKCLQIRLGDMNEPTDYEFVSSADLVQQVVEAKTRLSGTSHELFTLARGRTNPFDKIDRAIFMNRAATKLAVLDVLFNLTAVSDSSQTFQFADICGGPGGFSEYILWRAHTSGQAIHGYGITLKGEEDKDWRLNAFHPDANVQQSLTIIDGQDHTGDICNPENITTFATRVLQETNQQGVDLVVADGGINFEGQQDKQELIARQLLVCQMAAMLSCLRKDGKYVCKFFDITLESTAGLVWLLYQCFESICITKPLTSRPANAERYIVCEKLRFSRPQPIIDFLLQVNQGIRDEKVTQKRVCAVVDRVKIEQDEAFMDYMKMRNMKLAIKQLEALEHLEAFVQQPHNGAMEPDQSTIRRRCIHEWRLPLN